MQLLQLNFLIYSFGGIWRPVEWSSNGAKLLYSMFSLCIIISMYIFMLSQFMDIVLVVDNIDDFANNSLMFVTIVAVCCKATVAVLRRNEIIDLVQMLSKEPFRPRDKDEAAIQIKFDEFIRSYTIKVAILTANSFMGVTIRSVMNIRQGELPFKVWLPYNYNIPAIFWTTSMQQIVTLSFAASINVANETLIFGLFLQTCAQLEIFECRLHKSVFNKVTQNSGYFSSALSNEGKGMISEYICYHLNIYKYAKTVNNIFNEILFVQFFGSILTLCTSVFYLSTHILETEAATMLVYTIGMFVQIFLYCWSGNEVILKSTSLGNAIYHMDWPSLSITEKRDLLMIMRRSTIPIKFTSSFLITFSLESYSNILKTSYSSFNLLQQR